MNRINEIKRRYARGLHHKVNWMANTGYGISREYGIPKATMLEALASGRPPRSITQAQLDEAIKRVAYGRKEHDLYLKDSSVAICRDFKIGDRTLRTIVEDSISEDDPVRRFLTMRLVA